MQPLRRLAQFYVDLLVKLGIWKFSMLLALAIIVFAMVIQMSVTWVFEGRVEAIDLIRSVFFGIVVTPWAVYFLSVVVDQIEESRRQLTDLVDELEAIHQREAKQNQQLSHNIKQLNQEITDRIKAEQARLQLVETLKEEVMQRKRYQDALEQASRDKTTFISTISHELRTPLNGIIGLSRILADSPLSAQQQNYLNTIQLSAITLSHIFNDIIEVDKLERGKQKLDIKPIDFIRFLADIENISTLLIQQKGLEFNFRPLFEERGQNIPLSIATDETRVRQILWNLISNAVKFTDTGVVEMRVFFHPDAQDKLVFEVEDSGTGIPLEEQESIFEMYYQVNDKYGGKPATGTGIGLAVSRTLARKLGGDLTVRSEYHHGSCFCLTIDAPITTLLDSNEVQIDKFEGLHVLLVEDIELNIIVATSVLEKLGCHITIARTGKEALVELTTNKFDLALLDIQLPDMTGLDIARQYKEIVNTSSPRLIALTANVLEDYSAYHKVGIEGVLNKPLSIPALVQVLSGNHPFSMNHQQVFSKDINGRDTHCTQQILDETVLNDYIQMIGEGALSSNLSVLEGIMIEYLTELNDAIIREDIKQIKSLGHKIKGACASLGLIRLQEVAKCIQNYESQIDFSVLKRSFDTLNECWKEDVELLHTWIKNNPRR
ncbi:ATP-binding protein [Thorsellia kenyensis]|uniref:Aerobic respiration control sensor protein n=1 Tax=Thorsellia kenyensis TaxID=1549888 RepID=A0ABV6CD32_9GAMM